MIFTGNKMAVARFVSDCLVSLDNDLLLITITSQAKSVDCFARIATVTSLEGIVAAKAMRYSLKLIVT